MPSVPELPSNSTYENIEVYYMVKRADKDSRDQTDFSTKQLIFKCLVTL